MSVCLFSAGVARGLVPLRWRRAFPVTLLEPHLEQASPKEFNFLL